MTGPGGCKVQAAEAAAGIYWLNTGRSPIANEPSCWTPAAAGVNKLVYVLGKLHRRTAAPSHARVDAPSQRFQVGLQTCCTHSQKREDAKKKKLLSCIHMEEGVKMSTMVLVAPLSGAEQVAAEGGVGGLEADVRLVSRGSAIEMSHQSGPEATYHADVTQWHCEGGSVPTQYPLCPPLAQRLKL